MADLKKILLGARKVLGKLTDLLMMGRNAGLWTEKPGIGGASDKGLPHQPGQIGRK